MDVSTINPDLNFRNIEYDEYTSDSELDASNIDLVETKKVA